MANLSVVFLLVTLISCTQVNGKAVRLNKAFDTPHVFFTVNSISGVNKTDGSLTNRKLELHWQNFNVVDNDWMGIFSYDPMTYDESTDQGDLALETYSVVNGTGYQLTNVRLPVMDLTQVSPDKDNCFGFWLAYFNDRDNRPVHSNCFRMYPTWMNDLKDTIGDVPLHSLMIPGTHDTGAWKVYEGTDEDDNIIAKYTFTQEENIWNQLAYGIRYLDVRVAHYPNTDAVFWVNHGVMQISPLEYLLNNVTTFAKTYKEIIFMDFHRFPVGFDDETVHQKLYEFVYGIMGDNLAPDSLSNDVTLNQLWEANKLVILTYGDNFHTKYDVLWPSLEQAWGDKNTVEELENYLEGAMTDYGCQGQFWSAMAEETPTTNDIISKPGFGLRGFAQEVNEPLSQWCQRESWYSKAHIIATDFFLGNNVIEMSTRVNKERLTCK